MKSHHWGGFTACIFMFTVTTADAALVSRLGGQAVYDTDLDITWIADANLAASNAFSVAGIRTSGSMNWATANTWIGNMNATNYLGFNDWRLPVTPQPDASCGNQADQGAGFPLQGSGSGCTGSEMGHLSNVEGVSVATPGLFSNVRTGDYWSGTEYAPNSSLAWDFIFGHGLQSADNKGFDLFAWAVRPGDVSAVPVPVPAALWLFGSGLMGLLGLARRKRTVNHSLPG